MLPCGTPDRTGSRPDLVPFTLTDWDLLSVRYKLSTIATDLQQCQCLPIWQVACHEALYQKPCFSPSTYNNAVQLHSFVGQIEEMVQHHKKLLNHQSAGAKSHTAAWRWIGQYRFNCEGSPSSTLDWTLNSAVLSICSYTHQIYQLPFFFLTGVMIWMHQSLGSWCSNKVRQNRWGGAESCSAVFQDLRSYTLVASRDVRYWNHPESTTWWTQTTHNRSSRALGRQ